MRTKREYVYDGKLFDKTVGTPVFNYKAVIRHERVYFEKRKAIRPEYAFGVLFGLAVFLLLLTSG